MPDKFEAMEQIRKIAAQAQLAVSIITVDDALIAAGVDLAGEDPTPEQTAAVINSWEWNHYGDNWSDWFSAMDV